MKKIYWTTEKLIELKKLYETGESYEKLSKHFSSSVSGINKTLTRYQLREKQRVTVEEKKVSAAEKSKIINKRVLCGLPLESLSDLLIWAKSKNIFAVLEGGSLNKPLKDRLCCVLYNETISSFTKGFDNDFHLTAQLFLRKVNEFFSSQHDEPITVNGITDF